MRNLYFLTICLLPAGVLAQNALYLSPGASLYINSGTPVAIDSLVLTPSTDYTITGSNSMQRAATALHSGSNPYIRRVYQWANTLPPFTGNVSLYYQDGELNGLNETQLSLQVHNGSGWNTCINNIVRNSTDNLITTTISGIALNELTLVNAAQGPLPLVWLEITAQRRNNAVQISWQTADETNCAGYQVEKSSNGINWNNLGAALNAHNTTGPNNYNQVDATLPTAISFYRVRQLDLDGRYSYSKTVSVKNDQSNGIWLYPIPANDVLTVVSGNQPLKGVNIYTSAGSLAASAQLQQAVSYSMNIQQLAAGNYTALIILNDNSTITKNFIKR
ncbi:hypothetical protein A3860_10125 [Niastella vici]|uniref:Secretion system C-terminal sorting domain-containing protein n=1 Tax=Niastella vici TaxID=1703345 RepID=A0A1V9FEY7_9BACT|nr:T9SS type A sorting domain-containing protein [Niastella vici]OQP56924.1 hypothetical protein A3860_10125 [Niastella vici]